MQQRRHYQTLSLLSFLTSSALSLRIFTFQSTYRLWVLQTSNKCPNFTSLKCLNTCAYSIIFRILVVNRLFQQEQGPSRALVCPDRPLLYCTVLYWPPSELAEAALVCPDRPLLSHAVRGEAHAVTVTQPRLQSLIVLNLELQTKVCEDFKSGRRSLLGPSPG